LPAVRDILRQRDIEIAKLRTENESLNTRLRRVNDDKRNLRKQLARAQSREDALELQLDDQHGELSQQGRFEMALRRTASLVSADTLGIASGVAAMASYSKELLLSCTCSRACE